MSDAVVCVEGIGKRYFIGERARQGGLLRDAIANVFRNNGKSGGKRASREIIWAVRDVSFEVNKGEVVGLIGRNGAGKSTLLKLLARITRPTVGHAELRGRIASLLEVGTGFHPELTGRDNIFLSGAILGMRKNEILRKFDEIVAFSEVERFIDTPLKHYSSGMAVRLAFGVAAHLEPEILLVDEVLSVGDASFQKKCLGKMHEVSHGGRTILFVSHNLAALKKLCTRAVLLDGGQIIENGEASEVVRRYLQRNTVANLQSLWEDERAAPGDDRVRLRSVRLILLDDSSDHITVHTPLRIEFTYWNYVPEAVLSVSMILNNLEEVCTFATASDFVPRPIGLICHTVEIPGDLLNVGSYYVNMLVVKDASIGILFQNNVLAFDVAEGEVVGNWYGPYPGAVRPKLKWTTEVIASTGFAAAK